MEFQRVSQTSGRGSRWNITSRSMCRHGQRWWVGCEVYGGSVSSKRSSSLWESKGLLSQGHAAVTFTTDLKDGKGRNKLNMAEKHERTKQKSTWGMIFGRLTAWTATVFGISVKSLASSGSDVCYVRRLNLTLISLSPSPSSGGTEPIQQINLCRHTLLHPRQTRTTDSIHGRCKTNWWEWQACHLSLHNILSRAQKVVIKYIT